MKLSYLFNSIFLFSDFQSGKSCVRWSCVAPFRSPGLKHAACILPVTADITLAEERVIEGKEVEPRRSRSKLALHRYAVVESALLRYKQTFGDTLVPKLFVIPSDDKSWPEETWGMKLGATVNHIRSGNGYSDNRKELISIGFDFSYYAVVKSALLRYKEMHGDILVSSKFIIPCDDESWPRETWGMKLGKSVSDIRRGDRYPGQREELISIGFDYGVPSARHGYAAVKAALVRYMEKYGDMLMLYDYMIPAGDESWPVALQGMKLGHVVHNIICGYCHQDQLEDLKSMGFV